MKRADPPVLLLRGIRCGNIGNFWGQGGKEECKGEPFSKPGMQFVYGGWDMHAKDVVTKVFVFLCY